MSNVYDINTGQPIKRIEDVIAQPSERMEAELAHAMARQAHKSTRDHLEDMREIQRQAAKKRKRS